MESILPGGEVEAKQAIERSRRKYKHFNLVFLIKELLDRLSYGFAGYQYMTILLFLTGASAFVVSIVTALREVVVSLLSSVLHDYSRIHAVGKSFIARSGLVFGFSFFGILLALRIKSVLLFAISLVIGSIGIVAYGEFYVKLIDEYIPHERRSSFLRKAGHYGLLISAIAFFIAGFVLEIFHADQPIQILNWTLPVSGSFLLVETTAILCIISASFLNQLPTREHVMQKSFKDFRKTYFHQIKTQLSLFFKNKYEVLLLLGAIAFAIVHTLGASLYGYHIYDTFKDVAFGGFFNIAIIFTIAILVSFIGPWLANWLKHHIGLAPLFVFAGLLQAMLPLALIYNPYFWTVTVATSLSVLGASLLGVSQSLLIRKLLFASERRLFFQSSSLLTAIPILIFVPLGGWLAFTQGFLFVFNILIAIIIFIMTPLYLILVLRSHRKKL